jgi:hypothetical protein
VPESGAGSSSSYIVHCVKRDRPTVPELLTLRQACGVKLVRPVTAAVAVHVQAVAAVTAVHVLV